MTNYGRRGMDFEGLINHVNQLYQNRNIAIINKRPTPVKVIKSKGTRILSGFYEAKSTVDYDGIYHGHSIFFDAKTVQTPTRFDLKNIEQHQFEYLNSVERQGAISFVLIEFRCTKEVFLCPMNMIRHYSHMALQGGRKSIPKEDFDYYGYAVNDSGRVPCDYLACVDKLIEDGKIAK